MSLDEEIEITTNCKNCGKALKKKQIKYHAKFCCRRCSSIWVGANVLKGTKYKKREKEQPNTDYYKYGKTYCKNYNDADLKCVICYEQRYLDSTEKDCAL